VFTETDRKLPREQGSLTMTPFFVTDIISVSGALFSFEVTTPKTTTPFYKKLGMVHLQHKPSSYMVVIA
jgi:hypothetical protein